MKDKNSLFFFFFPLNGLNSSPRAYKWLIIIPREASQIASLALALLSADEEKKKKKKKERMRKREKRKKEREREKK